MSEDLHQQVADPIFGPVVFSITRRQLLDDGTLIDVSEVAKEAGLRIPVAMTAEAWADCVGWTERDTRQQTHQDPEGRLWVVLWMAHIAIQQQKQTSSELLFELERIPRDGHSLCPSLARLKLLIGPGDNAEPVLTILLPHQD
ncbi:DUF6573 family protein [Pandoraea sp.]|uniref:DUF6573 family protein n=1 Tax=Pandoraea sp. TaxID=1883445 RepID=UPI00120A38A1|nr:DUF6573 family protein [Pandoraea sp.]TAL52748.1 MAG: hypothetical protein EPN80_17980 [Pandoraea sp.]TAM17730.1 MAG: hypothetical protein EPN65_09935 [Pandoraea sp.]